MYGAEFFVHHAFHTVQQELYVLKPWVTTIVASAPLATAQEVQEYDDWVSSVPDAHIKEWRSQPGNYHLMTKQGECAGLGCLLAVDAWPGYCTCLACLLGI
jgi:hypothetical protein